MAIMGDGNRIAGAGSGAAKGDVAPSSALWPGSSPDRPGRSAPLILNLRTSSFLWLTQTAQARVPAQRCGSGTRVARVAMWGSSGRHLTFPIHHIAAAIMVDKRGCHHGGRAALRE